MLLKYFAVSLMFGTLVSAVSGMEDAATAQVAERREAFYTAREMFDHANALDALLDKSDYDQILHLSVPAPRMEIPGIVSASDLEYYLFNRARALHHAYKDLAKKNQFNPEKAQEAYRSAIFVISAYLSVFNNYQTQIASLKDRMAWHKFIVTNNAASNYYELFMLGGTNQAEEYALSVLPQAILFWEAALERAQEAQKILQPDEWEPICSRLPEIQFYLVSCYCSCIQFKSAEVTLKRPRELTTLIKNAGRPDLYADALKSLEIAELFLQKRVLNQKPLGSARVNTLRSQKWKQLNGTIVAQVVDFTLDKEGETNTTSYEVQCILQKMDTCFDDLATKGHKEITQGLFDIERMIAQELSVTNKEEPSLLKVYQTLGTLLRGDVWIRTGWKYLVAFLIDGNIDAGVERAEILKILEQDKCGSVSLLNRLVCAGFKNLNGNHEEWLALQAELDQKDKAAREKKKEAKQRRKERAKEIMLTGISQSRTQAQQEAEAKEKKRKEAGDEKNKSQPILAPAKPQETGEVFSPSDPFISLEEQQRARKERHAEAEQKRAKAAILQPAAVERPAAVARAPRELYGRKA